MHRTAPSIRLVRGLLGAGIALVSPQPVSAGPQTSATQVPERGEEILVTAPRPILADQPIDGHAATIAVVGRAQMDALNAIDLPSALRRTPGVVISRYNPVGAFGGADGGGVFIRGRGQSRPGADLRTFFDGAPVYMGVFNHPLMDILPIQAAGEIRVRKGPQPHRFGNGVAAVEIVPEDEAMPGIRTRLLAAGGAFATARTELLNRGREGPFDWLVGGAFVRSRGHRPDAAGRLANGLVRGRWMAPGGLEARLTWMRAESFALDPGPEGRPDLRNGRYESGVDLLSGAVSRRGEHAGVDVMGYRTVGRGHWLRQAGTTGDTLTDWRGSGLRARLEVTPAPTTSLEAGFDYERIRGETRFRPIGRPGTDFVSPTFAIGMPWAAVSQTVEAGELRLTPSAGIRGHIHSDFPSSAAPFFGLVAAHGPLSARVNWARGVSYPGLDVVVFATAVVPGLGQSWRDLRPERVDHLELGFRYETPTVRLDLAWFDDRGRDRYVFVPPPPPPPRYVNRGGVRISGLEASASVGLGADWSVFAGLTHLRPEPETVPYAPRVALSAGLTGRAGPWTLAIDLQHQGRQRVLAQSRAFGAVNAVMTDGFTLVSGRAGRAFGPLELFVAVENLTDTRYAYRPGYPMPGINAQAGMVVRL